MTRRSKYDLYMAFNYLRLAFQAMNRNPREAEEVIAHLHATQKTVEDKLRVLAEIVSWRTKVVENFALADLDGESDP